MQELCQYKIVFIESNSENAGNLIYLILLILRWFVKKKMQFKNSNIFKPGQSVVVLIVRKGNFIKLLDLTLCRVFQCGKKCIFLRYYQNFGCLCEVR